MFGGGGGGQKNKQKHNTQKSTPEKKNSKHQHDLHSKAKEMQLNVPCEQPHFCRGKGQQVNTYHDITISCTHTLKRKDKEEI